MFKLCRKLKALKYPLRSLSKSSYSNIHSGVLDAKEKLLNLQMQLLSWPSDRLSQLEKAEAHLLVELSFVEESFLRQKSRIRWLKDGDQNTIFFP